MVGINYRNRAANYEKNIILNLYILSHAKIAIEVVYNVFELLSFLPLISYVTTVYDTMFSRHFRKPTTRVKNTSPT